MSDTRLTFIIMGCLFAGFFIGIAWGAVAAKGKQSATCADCEDKYHRQLNELRGKWLKAENNLARMIRLAS